MVKNIRLKSVQTQQLQQLLSKQLILVVDLDKVALVAGNPVKEVQEGSLAKAVDQEVDKADKNSKEP